MDFNMVGELEGKLLIMVRLIEKGMKGALRIGR